MPAMTLLVRTDGPVPGLADAIRRAVWEVDAALPVPDVRPLARSRRAAVAGPRFNTLTLTTFAAVAFTLAAVGLYGLLGFLVARRTREIGVRRALGAPTRAVSRMIIRRGVALTATGVATGLVAAFLWRGAIEGLLFRTGGTDPVVFLVVPLLFTVVAVVAAWVPAHRAAKVDPLIALRNDG